MLMEAPSVHNQGEAITTCLLCHDGLAPDSTGEWVHLAERDADHEPFPTRGGKRCGAPCTGRPDMWQAVAAFATCTLVPGHSCQHAFHFNTTLTVRWSDPEGS